MKFEFDWSDLFMAVYEGDGTDPGDDGEGNADPLASDPSIVLPPLPPAPGAKKPPGEKTFTQADVNKFLADDRRKAEKQRLELETRLTALSTDMSLSQAERDRYKQNVSDLQAQFLTKEERQKAENEQVVVRLREEAEAAAKKASSWETLYTESTITQALQSAAIKGDAYNPSQVVVQLRNQTRLIEKMDEHGKSTGALVPVVDITAIDKETGQVKRMQMTPDEAVDHMKSHPQDWGNFFKSNIKDGVGTSNGTGDDTSGTLDPSTLSTAQYLALRKKNPKALGLNREQR